MALYRNGVILRHFDSHTTDKECSNFLQGWWGQKMYSGKLRISLISLSRRSVYMGWKIKMPQKNTILLYNRDIIISIL